MLQSLILKVKRSLVRRGVSGTLRHAMQAAGHKFWECTSTGRRECRMQQVAELEFDRTHNIETKGLIDLSVLSIDSENWMYGSRYQGVSPRLFQEMMECSCIRYQDFLFIDLGSGKGRALLLASEFPFRRIVGVEFSPELVDVSRRNIQNYRSETQRCRDISVICEDAATFRFPNEPIVLFLYNPFDQHVMGRVVENIYRSLGDCMREFIVLYAMPWHGELWDSPGIFRKVKSVEEVYAVWRSSPLKASNMWQ